MGTEINVVRLRPVNLVVIPPNASMPKYVLTDKETIPEWLYPGTWGDLSTHEADALREHSEIDLESLWQTINPQADVRVAYLFQPYEDVGIPHDCPDVNRVNPNLLEALVAVLKNEQYLLIQKWLGNINSEKLSRTKTQRKNLTELARRAIESGKMIAILPDNY